MNQDQLRSLLEQVREGAVDVDAAMTRVRHMPFEDLGFAKVDHHRELRHGMPEVILAKGKTPDQVVAIAERLLAMSQNVLITRADAATAAAIEQSLTGGEYFPLSGAMRFWRDKTVRGKGKIAVVCAGTSDIPVAEEAHVTAEVMGNQVESIYDVGVAGIHRLMESSARLAEARVLVVCAGMEGALPSVVGGLVSCPGDRRAHQRRLWRELPRPGRAARHAEQLRQQRDRRQYRQWLRRGLRGQPDQPPVRCMARRHIA